MIGADTRKWRETLAERPREELISIIKRQNPELWMHVERIEGVFAKRMTHLTWADGTPITGRPVTNEELALLIDQPFDVDTEMTKMGLSAEQQFQAHIADDPVLWARHFLKAEPRAYQVWMLRHPKLRKILRAGRRLGKSYTMALKMLHRAFTANYAKVLVMAPMKSQVELLYKEVMKLLENNQHMHKSIKRSVTSPQFHIEFTNGSTISFFTTGVSSGGKSTVVRGQEAHLIILDEMDYMAPDDLDAVYVMLQDTVKGQAPKELIAASTPTGLKGTFWKWCHDTRRFKEFWFPSYCNPEWKMETEEEFREQYTEMAYRHEVEADWGESTMGVYPRRYVDFAFNAHRLLDLPDEYDHEDRQELSDWKYSFDRLVPGSDVVLGVDWDKYGAGVNITALEIIPSNYHDPRFAGRIRVMFREEMDKGEFALLKAVERIKELNGRLQLKWIYVDKGYGETQVELLHKHGLDDPTTGLRKKVKAIKFGGTTEVRDPGTKQLDKKETKIFMVEQLRYILEIQRLAIPASDEVLYEQLISYQMAAETLTGRPKFKMAGTVPDHAHDSLLLAVHAITEHYSEFFKRNVARQMHSISNANLTGLPGDEKAPKEIPIGVPLNEYRGRDGPKSKRIKRPGSMGVKMGRQSIRRKMW